MLKEKITNFLNAPDEAINLGSVKDLKLEKEIKIYWGEEPIGTLLKGSNIYSPRAEAINSELLDSENKILISAKLQHWIDNKIKSELKPIKEKIEDNTSSEVRAIAFNTFNNLGTLLIGEYYSFIKTMNDSDKAMISKLGLRIGAKFFFTPSFLKKSAMELCAILWKVYNEFFEDLLFPLPKDGRVSFESSTEMPHTYWASIGYHCINNFALRIDVFERVFFLARQKIKFGPFIESADMMNPIGCNSNQLKNILAFCGFHSIELGNEKKLFYFKQKKQANNNSVKNIKIKIKK